MTSLEEIGGRSHPYCSVKRNEQSYMHIHQLCSSSCRISQVYYDYDDSPV